MKKRDRLFISLEDAVFYIVLLAGATLFNVFFELQAPTSRLHKVMFITALVLLHEYYQLFRSNKLVGKRLAIEGYTVIVSLVILLIVALCLVMDADGTIIRKYDLSDCWYAFLLIPVVAVTGAEFCVSVRASYKSHVEEQRDTNTGREKRPIKLSGAAKSI